MAYEDEYEEDEYKKGKSRDRTEKLRLSANMAQQGAQSGTAEGTAGGALAGYGMYAGDPYTMAAGLTLQAFAAAKQKKQAAKEANERAKYEARLSKLDNQLRAIGNMQTVARGLRNL